MGLHPDFRDLLGEFVRAGVRFAVLGGYAVGIHGRPRATKDLDLLGRGPSDRRDSPVYSVRSVYRADRMNGVTFASRVHRAGGSRRY